MNSVILQGRLTRDIELKYTSQSQTAIGTFTLAVNRIGKDNEADFIRVTAFGKQAESAEKYIGKGCRALVQGRIQTGSYTDKNGKTVYTTDVIADRIEYIDFKNRDSDVLINIPEDDQGFRTLEEDIPF